MPDIDNRRSFLSYMNEGQNPGLTLPAQPGTQTSGAPLLGVEQTPAVTEDDIKRKIIEAITARGQVSDQGLGDERFKIAQIMLQKAHEQFQQNPQMSYNLADKAYTLLSQLAGTASHNPQ